MTEGEYATNGDKFVRAAGFALGGGLGLLLTSLLDGSPGIQQAIMDSVTAFSPNIENVEKIPQYLIGGGYLVSGLSTAAGLVTAPIYAIGAICDGIKEKFK